MKISRYLSLIPLCVYATAFAEEITVAQPELPKVPQEKYFDFTPPVAIGELSSANEKLSTAEASQKFYPETAGSITLAQDGKIVITRNTDQKQ